MRLAHRLVSAALCVASSAHLVAPTPVASAEIKATSRIETVTVFPQGAEITRIAKFKLDAGEHAVVLADLPGQAIASSIRVEGRATGKLELGSVDARRSFVTSEDAAVALSARKKLEDEIERLKDQRTLDDNAILGAESQRAYLDNLAKLPATPMPAGGAGPREDWNGMFGLIGSRMAEVTKALTEARWRQRAIDRKVADLQKEIASTAPRQVDRTEVKINATAAAPLEATLTVRYQVNAAAWSPLYDAKLATGDKATTPKLTLSRRATIRQSTAEDWDDVTLTLSTTRPGLATAAPELAMLSVDFEQPQQPADAAGYARSPAKPASESVRGRLDEAKEQAENNQSTPVGGTGKFNGLGDAASEAQTTVSIGAFQALFEVPGRQTLKSAQDAKRVAISTEEIDAALVVRTVPRLDQTAYLYTRFTLPKTSSPLLAGEAALFRDGTFVGNGRLAALAPGEEHDLGFGADDLVKVKRVTLDAMKGETGTFSTSRVEERNFEIAVRNLHPRAVLVHVLDRVPVSAQQDIKVEAVYKTAPTKRDNNDRRGTSLWELPIEPGQEKKVAFGYRVTWPPDKRVRYFELTPEEIMMQNVLRY